MSQAKECGCKIQNKYTQFGHDLDYKGSKIIYCPLHASAGELREALRTVQKQFNKDGNMTGDHWQVCEDALAASERKG